MIQYDPLDNNHQWVYTKTMTTETRAKQYKRLQVELEKDTHQAFMLWAMNRGLKMSEIVRSFIEKILKEDK